jgi:hypothetical protein
VLKRVDFTLAITGRQSRLLRRTKFVLVRRTASYSRYFLGAPHVSVGSRQSNRVYGLHNQSPASPIDIIHQSCRCPID